MDATSNAVTPWAPSDWQPTMQARIAPANFTPRDCHLLRDLSLLIIRPYVGNCQAAPRHCRTPNCGFTYSMAEQRYEAAAAMNHVHDVYARRRDTVENQVFSDWKTSIARSQFVALTPGIGVVAQQTKMMNQQVYKTVCRRLIVPSDMPPEIKHVSACPPRQPVSHQDCSRSFRASRFSSSASCGSAPAV